MFIKTASAGLYIGDLWIGLGIHYAFCRRSNTCYVIHDWAWWQLTAILCGFGISLYLEKSGGF